MADKLHDAAKAVVDDGVMILGGIEEAVPRTAMDALRAALAELEAEVAKPPTPVRPRAYMRRWAFDKVDVMKLKRPDRPRGWMMAEVSLAKFYPDDVPLYAGPTPTEEASDA